jgi:hypothetical protein
VADLHEVLEQLQVGLLGRPMPSYTLRHRSPNYHNKSPKVWLCNILFKFAILLHITNVQGILCQISQKLSKSLRHPVYSLKTKKTMHACSILVNRRLQSITLRAPSCYLPLLFDALFLLKKDEITSWKH